ncbi:sodium:proton antiporter [Burkholderia multivorans]|uniref:sodium:proton antiporter n=1 Tax=Burkholderia multivorans TaxID=87883 RepID=UPI00338DD55A
MPVGGHGVGGCARRGARVRFGRDTRRRHAVRTLGHPVRGILLSIALFPLVAPAFWHTISARSPPRGGCVPRAVRVRVRCGPAFGTLVHALLEEYVPFIVLLTALYTSPAASVKRQSARHASSTAILALARARERDGHDRRRELLIRPLLRANDNRKHVVHVVIFFIFRRRECGRFAVAARSAPLPFELGFSGRRRASAAMLVALLALSSRDTYFTGKAARSGRPRSIRRPTAARCRSTARSTSCCWRPWSASC